MQVISTWRHCKECGELVAAMGFFDGVHKGHQRLISLAHAKKNSFQRVAVLTFEPHPLSIINPDLAPKLLTVTSEKERLLSRYGVDLCLKIPFDTQIARLSPEKFIDRLLGLYQIRHIVVGYNNRFGCNAKGDASFLRSLGQKRGFGVSILDPVRTEEGRLISSSNIRALVANRLLCEAREMLGHPFSLSGRIVSGYGRGQCIGFPTANVKIPERKLVPPDGVYVAEAFGSDFRCLAVVNIGNNPTFDNPERSVEAFFIDYEGDLYGESVCLELVDYLRSEQRFSSVAELRRQIRSDVETAKRVIGVRSCVAATNI